MMNSQCMVAQVGHPGGVTVHCSDDVVTIWHGMSSPAVACGFHATYYAAEVYRARREIASRELLTVPV